MFPKNFTRYTVLKKIHTQVHHCQGHQLDQLMLNTLRHDIRKTFIIVMGTGSLAALEVWAYI